MFFNQPVVEMQWPTALLELDFGLNFNMPIEGAVLPPGLESICFGRCFNQDVTRLSWPEGLLRVGVALGGTLLRKLVLPSLPYIQHPQRGVLKRFPTPERTQPAGESIVQKDSVGNDTRV